jgi:hypothetical protein
VDVWVVAAGSFLQQFAPILLKFNRLIPSTIRMSIPTTVYNPRAKTTFNIPANDLIIQTTRDFHQR